MLSFSKDHDISISPSIVVFTVAFLLSLYFLFSISSIIELVFLAYLLMVALHGVVMKLHTKLHLPRIISIAITYVLLLVAVIGTVVYLLPTAASEVYSFVTTLNFPWLQDKVSALNFTVTELSSLANQLQTSAGTVFSVIMTTFSGIFALFTVLVMSLYLMLDRDKLHLRLFWFTKDKALIDKMELFFNSLEAQLGSWVRGELILMLAIGVTTAIGLRLLGIPYALPLGILAGFLEMLPNLGPTLSAVPSIVIAFVNVSPLMGGVVALFYVVVQQFENSFLVPKIMKDNVDVSPLISIISILVGFQLGSVLGALIAIPVYITLRTIYSIWLRDRVQL